MGDENKSRLITSDGTAAHFHLQKGYQYRDECVPYDDQSGAAEWQDHVYAMAHDIAVSRKCGKILDIGCGSGFKLMKYFSAFETLGLELPHFVDQLQQRYPDRKWAAVPSGSSGDSYPPADLYICSDVIEHIRHPDIFLDRLAKSPFRYLVLSTPTREVLFADGKRGFLTPPENPSHHFEWTMGELHKLCSEYVNILDHIYQYNGEYTQIIVAEQKC